MAKLGEDFRLDSLATTEQLMPVDIYGKRKQRGRATLSSKEGDRKETTDPTTIVSVAFGMSKKKKGKSKISYSNVVKSSQNRRLNIILRENAKEL